MVAPGEAALAVIGISNVIKGEVGKIGVEKLAEMNEIDAVITKKALALANNTLDEPTLPRQHNYRATLDRLSRPLSQRELRDLGEKFHDDGLQHMAEFLAALPGAYQHLKDLFPTSDYQSFAGPTALVPDTERVWTFFAQLQVINDPVSSVFELIGAGAILQSQVKAVREFFPTLSKAIGSAIYQVVVDKRAEKLSYRLPPRAETGVAVWLGRRLSEPGSASSDPPTPPPIQRPPMVKLSKTLESQGQQASNPSA